MDPMGFKICQCVLFINHPDHPAIKGYHWISGTTVLCTLDPFSPWTRPLAWATDSKIRVTANSLGNSVDWFVIRKKQKARFSWMRRTLTGWWFGTWILWLSIYWECHHPNWRTHIFQRGWTTNQIMKLKHKISVHCGTLERFWPKEHTKASHLSNAPNARKSWAMRRTWLAPQKRTIQRRYHENSWNIYFIRYPIDQNLPSELDLQQQWMFSL